MMVLLVMFGEGEEEKGRACWVADLPRRTSVPGAPDLTLRTPHICCSRSIHVTFPACRSHHGLNGLVQTFVLIRSQAGEIRAGKLFRVLESTLCEKDLG